LEKVEYEQFEEFKPILPNKKVEVSEEKKDENSEREIQRKAIIAEKLQKIGEVYNEARELKLDNYSEKFHDSASKDTILLAEVDVQTLNNENDRLANLKAQKEAQEKYEYELHREELKRVEEDSQSQLIHRGGILKKQLYRIEQENIERTEKKHRLIKGAFEHTTETLKKYLVETKQEVEIKYRDLSIADKSDRHNLSNSQAKPSEISAWKHQHQVVEVRIELVRCVKDKLPKGRYAILCSILDRVGGNPIDYGLGKSKKWRRITAPKIHSGEYYLNNLRFEKSLLIVAPPRADIRPSMVYLFELFLLKSKEYTNDQVLGWGVFPLIDSEFELNKGKFKVFLFRRRFGNRYHFYLVQ